PSCALLPIMIPAAASGS
ncbi:hypothetical protein HZ326_19163, partial [Fusarium oxysporum f. sp. albedinis]